MLKRFITINTLALFLLLYLVNEHQITAGETDSLKNKTILVLPFKYSNSEYEKIIKKMHIFFTEALSKMFTHVESYDVDKKRIEVIEYLIARDSISDIPPTTITKLSSLNVKTLVSGEITENPHETFLTLIIDVLSVDNNEPNKKESFFLPYGCNEKILKDSMFAFVKKIFDKIPSGPITPPPPPPPPPILLLDAVSVITNSIIGIDCYNQLFDIEIPKNYSLERETAVGKSKKLREQKKYSIITGINSLVSAVPFITEGSMPIKKHYLEIFYLAEVAGFLTAGILTGIDAKNLNNEITTQNFIHDKTREDNWGRYQELNIRRDYLFLNAAISLITVIEIYFFYNGNNTSRSIEISNAAINNHNIIKNVRFYLGNSSLNTICGNPVSLNMQILLN
ncbi:MAG: hypothetical protein V1773_11605 [bacterium]